MEMPLRWRVLFLAVVLLPGAAWGQQTARELLKEKRDHRLWEEAGRCAGAERYLKAFPEGLHAAEARECLEAGQVERLLEECEAHLAAGRLSTASRGGNAVDCYGEVLSLDRGNREALSGLERVMEEYGSRVREALEGGRLERARGYLERMAELNAESREVEELEDAVAEAEREAAERTDPEAVERGLKLSREEKRLIQMGLAAAGQDPGSADGMIGRGTRGAVRRWQGARGEPVTGYLDADEAKELLALGKREEERLRVAAEVRAREEAQRREREAEERRRVEARKPGDTFRDCPGCPEMVVVPAGRFMMGSTSGAGNERPVHPVTIARPFAVGVYEVMFGEWDACVSGGGCGGYRPGDEGWGRGRRPVINVSWKGAQAYVRWLSGKTGAEYRLLSESEWEYVARAGTRTRYWWGDGIGRNRANCDGCGSRWDDERTSPVGTFSPNAFGLYDVHGNVREWVEDCWNDSYHGAPSDGSARTLGNCSRRVLRGGSWFDIPGNLRSANRNLNPSGIWNFFAGFRVARTLTP